MKVVKPMIQPPVKKEFRIKYQNGQIEVLDEMDERLFKAGAAMYKGAKIV